MSIKSLTYRLSMLLAVCALLFSSCGKDDEVVIDDVVGIDVGDGLYMSKTNVDPVASQVLTAEQVEDDGFATQDRDGFVAGYMYLEAGDYNMYQVASKAITDTLGGAAEKITYVDGEVGCGNNDYFVVTVAKNGAAINIGTAGLYKVTYDAMTGEALVYRIDQPNMIGSATPGGWGSDTNFPVANATSTGASWTATDVELREGEMKIRFNCRWTINRRTVDDWDPANGYQMFTNFGGTTDALAPGGSNIAIAADEEGLYTVTMAWTPSDEWALSLTKTGDVAPVTFVPDDNQWALTGSATPNGWANDDPADDPIGVDHDFNYEGVDAGTYSWMLSSINLVQGAIKFRANDAWDKNMGWNQVTLTGDIADLGSDSGDDGSDITVAVDGMYDIALSTSDDGETYTAEFTKL